MDLALQLVERAFADETHPLPVILPLSSWAVQRPSLGDWQIEQLARTYDAPRILSKRWVEQEQVLPLLDGLDEMEETARSACIAAINTYHAEHLTPLVVCSRQAEYEMAATQQRLALQSAMIVQPLSEAQIESYRSAAGPSFAGVRTALSQQQALRELATTPLMLSVLLLTYQGTSPNDIIQTGADLEQQVWTDYVARMVQQKGNNICYPLERTHAFLSWLARQMWVHQQTIFYAEYLQTDRLTLGQQRSAMWLATRLPAMVIGGCVGLLVFLLVQGGSDYVSLLQIGLLGGFIGDSFSLQALAGPTRIKNHPSNRKLPHLSHALLLGMLLAASCGLFLSPLQPDFPASGYSFIDWGRDGSLLGFGGGLSFGSFRGSCIVCGGSREGKQAHSLPGKEAWRRGSPG